MIQGSKSHPLQCGCKYQCPYSRGLPHPILPPPLVNSYHRCVSPRIPRNGRTPDFDPDCTLAIEARTDAPSNQHCKVTQLWPQPHIVEAVAHKVCIVNNTSEPRTIRRHEHLCQVRHTTTLDSASAPVQSPLPPSNNGDTSPRPSLFSDAVTVDPGHIIPKCVRHQFRQVLQTYHDVFNPTVVGYNGAAGPIEAMLPAHAYHAPSPHPRILGPHISELLLSLVHKPFGVTFAVSGCPFLITGEELQNQWNGNKWRNVTTRQKRRDVR